MAKMRIVFSYHGYPMSRAKEVVEDNITGNDEWQDYLSGILEQYGVTVKSAEVGKPFKPSQKDFVAVRVPVSVEYADAGGDKPLDRRMFRFCENAVDYEEGFYCDSCYWEEVK